MEPDLVNVGGVREIRTLTYELFAWKHEICVPEYCPTKTKLLWATFRVVSSQFSLVECLNSNSQLLLISFFQKIKDDYP